MKECPTCRRCYEDNSNFCPIDGIGLVMSIAGARLLGGKYRLERLIARGGMGAIYQAIQEGLARLVAVKVLNPELVNNPTALERFRREALAIAGLKHPNIVTIYDFGITSAGSSYIAMEFLKGQSLSKVLEQESRLSLERTMEIIGPICQALTEAHSKGIIHRDLKPDNIMLEQVGNTEVVKVVDFGLAKLKQRAEQRRITGNLVIGTFDYMSPEQCQSLELEATSDIYSLAIVMYEMLTGSVPFRGTSRLATIYQHINDPPRPPRSILPELPHEIEQVILKALGKEPDERQLTAADFLQELRAATEVVTKPKKTKGRPAPLREDTRKLNRVDENRKSANATLKKHLVFEHFLGRERELNRLMTEFAFIRSGRAKPIIILGDAGSGKTQLINEFRRRLNEDNAIFLNGRFFDYLGSTPYKPLLDTLTNYLRGLQPVQFEAIFGELASRVSKDLDDDWQLWRSSRPNSGSLQGGPEGEKYRIFEYLAQLYMKLARFQPVVLWMDDMQWADGLSLNFLSYLLRRALGEPIQFIFTARLQDVTQKGHPFQQWQSLVATARSVEQLQLQGLSTNEIEQYLNLVFTDIELPNEAIERLWQETHGNPYFLGEILRLLVEEEHIIWTGQRWRYEQLTEIDLPTSIVNIVDAHLRRFREEELDLFMQAAVLGEQFSFEELRLITGLNEDRLIDLVEVGLAGYVLKEQPNGSQNLRPMLTGADELYSFYHSTVRKVLYSKISTRRRRRLHQRVAESLEKFKKDRLEQLAPLLAHHYYHAEQFHLAFKYSVEAANAAWQALAIDEAESYIARIEELLKQIEEARTLEQQPDGSTENIGGLLAQPLALYKIFSGELLTARGQLGEAEQALNVALKLSEQTNDSSIKGRAILAMGELYKERNEQNQATEYFERAYQVYQEANHIVGECLALNRMAWANFEQASYQQASQYANNCVKLAQANRDRLAEAGARLILAATDYRTAHYGRALEGANMVLAIAQPSGDRVMERQAAGLLGVNSTALGLYNQALTWLDQALTVARDTGARRGESRLLVELGEAFRHQGKFQESLDYYTRAFEIGLEIRASREQEMALLSLGLVYKGLNYLDQAATYLRQAAALSQQVNDPVLIVSEQSAMAELKFINGDRQQALKLSEQALDLARRIGLRGQLWQILYLQGRIYRELGQPQSALEVLQESVNILKSICGDITDETTRKVFLSDKNVIVQLLSQLRAS